MDSHPSLAPHDSPPSPYVSSPTHCRKSPQLCFANDTCANRKPLSSLCAAILSIILTIHYTLSCAVLYSHIHVVAARILHRAYLRYACVRAYTCASVLARCATSAWASCETESLICIYLCMPLHTYYVLRVAKWPNRVAGGITTKSSHSYSHVPSVEIEFLPRPPPPPRCQWVCRLIVKKTVQAPKLKSMI